MQKIRTVITRIGLSLASVTSEDIVRSGVTFVLVVTSCYLFIRDGQVPVELLTITSMALGYFFGRVQSIATGMSGSAISTSGAGD